MSRTVVFAGDSITEWGRHDDPQDLGHGYVRLLADRLAGDRVVNAGVGGNRVGDLAQRWQRDVLDERPDVVSLSVGINDTWRRFDQGEATSAEAFGRTYRELVEQARETGAQLVLVEPFVVPVTPDQDAWLADLAEKQAAVRDIAREVGAVHVALAVAIAELASELGPAAVADDGVHPTARGHQVIADTWWAAWSAAPHHLHDHDHDHGSTP